MRACRFKVSDDKPTLRRLPLEFCRASRPPGPKLLLRDFLSLPAGFALFAKGCVAPISAVAFSLSRLDVILDRGTWAMERRERTRAAESCREDIVATGLDQRYHEHDPHNRPSESVEALIRSYRIPLNLVHSASRSRECKQTASPNPPWY